MLPKPPGRNVNPALRLRPGRGTPGANPLPGMRRDAAFA